MCSISNHRFCLLGNSEINGISKMKGHTDGIPKKQANKVGTHHNAFMDYHPYIFKPFPTKEVVMWGERILVYCNRYVAFVLSAFVYHLNYKQIKYALQYFKVENGKCHFTW